MKNVDFDNDTSKNIFWYPYIFSMASEILQGEEQFHSKNYLLEMSRSHAKMRLKSAPQKLNFLINFFLEESYKKTWVEEENKVFLKMFFWKTSV